VLCIPLGSGRLWAAPPARPAARLASGRLWGTAFPRRSSQAPRSSVQAAPRPPARSCSPAWLRSARGIAATHRVRRVTRRS